MPRPRKPIPAYRLHRSSGQAVVTVRDASGNRRDVLLGKYDSPESKAEYERIVNRLRVGAPAAATPGRTNDLTVNEMFLAFLEHAEGYYRRPDGTQTQEVSEYRQVSRVTRALYGKTPAAEFGPLALAAVRNRMIADGWCRNRINKQIGRLRRVFRWTASREQIPPGVYHSLMTVEGLRRGRSEAKERPPVGPVSAEHVAKTVEKLSPTVRAMVEFQTLTGARPGEVRTLRPKDIDRSGSVWRYCPPEHKNSYAGKSRTVAIGPKAQELLKPFLEGLQPDDYVFSPRRAVGEQKVARRAVRKSKVQPSQVDRSKPGGRRKAGQKYTSYSYAKAIRRACEAAEVPYWHPHQLRHSFATEVRKRFGLEAVQVLLGHSKADVSQIYAERDESLAAKIAGEVG